RPDGALVGRLPLGQVLHGKEPVSVARRLLEPLPRGGVAHLPLEVAEDRPRLPREELDHLVDDRAIVLLGHVADAGRETTLDVEIEARNPGAPARLRPLARPVRE